MERVEHLSGVAVVHELHKHGAPGVRLGPPRGVVPRVVDLDADHLGIRPPVDEAVILEVSKAVGCHLSERPVHGEGDGLGLGLGAALVGTHRPGLAGDPPRSHNGRGHPATGSPGQVGALGAAEARALGLQRKHCRLHTPGLVNSSRGTATVDLGLKCGCPPVARGASRAGWTTERTTSSLCEAPLIRARLRWAGGATAAATAARSETYGLRGGRHSAHHG
mmetsp:Transcript_11507/g.36379  ORF Transcript_11507/g.36379 Transcript_11507/m.36379 type:complete len:221 (-) Transcript_11507:515-1177(-)